MAPKLKRTFAKMGQDVKTERKEESLCKAREDSVVRWLRREERKYNTVF